MHNKYNRALGFCVMLDAVRYTTAMFDIGLSLHVISMYIKSYLLPTRVTLKKTF